MWKFPLGWKGKFSVNKQLWYYWKGKEDPVWEYPSETRDEKPRDEKYGLYYACYDFAIDVCKYIYKDATCCLDLHWSMEVIHSALSTLAATRKRGDTLVVITLDDRFHFWFGNACGPLIIDEWNTRENGTHPPKIQYVAQNVAVPVLQPWQLADHPQWNVVEQRRLAEVVTDVGIGKWSMTKDAQLQRDAIVSLRNTYPQHTMWDVHHWEYVNCFSVIVLARI